MMIDRQKEAYKLIHSIDSNVEPPILVLGSLCFKFIKKVKNEIYAIEPFMAKEHMKKYHMFSDENLCNTYKWLKENKLIWYSKSLLLYCLTDKAKKLLEIEND